MIVRVENRERKESLDTDFLNPPLPTFPVEM